MPVGGSLVVPRGRNQASPLAGVTGFALPTPSFPSPPSPSLLAQEHCFTYPLPLSFVRPSAEPPHYLPALRKACSPHPPTLPSARHPASAARSSSSLYSSSRPRPHPLPPRPQAVVLCQYLSLLMLFLRDPRAQSPIPRLLLAHGLQSAPATSGVIGENEDGREGHERAGLSLLPPAVCMSKTSPPWCDAHRLACVARACTQAPASLSYAMGFMVWRHASGCFEQEMLGCAIRLYTAVVLNHDLSFCGGRQVVELGGG